MSTSPTPLNLDPQPQPTKKKPLLPTPRTFLTNLVNAIATIPLLPAPPPPPDDGDDNGRITKTRAKESKVDNPLRRVPPSHRHLIVTLHVLFPGLVLPALDLLERGLVARVSLLDGKPAGQNAGAGAGAGAGGAGTGTGTGTGERGDVKADEVGGGWKPDQDSNQARDDTAAAAIAAQRRIILPHGKSQEEEGSRAFYLVASTAAATAATAAAAAAQDLTRERRRGRWRGGEGGEQSGKGYIVRLGAWQCSCAAFAFASVQGEGASYQWGAGGQEETLGLEDGGGEADGEMEWSFGGMSLDGLVPGTGVGVPVCKHLLACLLAERWSAALGGYVIERRVGREEMAGIAADV